MYVIEPITKESERNDFDCGIQDLNFFIKNLSRQNHEKNINKTFVASDETDPKIVIGFYTLSTKSITYDTAPGEVQKGFGKYKDVPAILIGRLAVDLKKQGKGLGQILLVDALKRAIRVSSQVGIYVVLIDAKNETTKKFYKKFGFLDLKDNNLTMFILMRTLQKAYVNF